MVHGDKKPNAKDREVLGRVVAAAAKLIRGHALMKMRVDNAQKNILETAHREVASFDLRDAILTLEYVKRELQKRIDALYENSSFD